MNNNCFVLWSGFLYCNLGVVLRLKVLDLPPTTRSSDNNTVTVTIKSLNDEFVHNFFKHFPVNLKDTLVTSHEFRRGIGDWLALEC